MSQATAPKSAPSEAAAAPQQPKQEITPELKAKAKSEVIRLHSELLAVTRSMPKEGKRAPKGVLFDIYEGVARCAQQYREAYALHKLINSE